MSEWGKDMEYQFSNIAAAKGKGIRSVLFTLDSFHLLVPLGVLRDTLVVGTPDVERAASVTHGGHQVNDGVAGDMAARYGRAQLARAKEPELSVAGHGVMVCDARAFAASRHSCP